MLWVTDTWVLPFLPPSWVGTNLREQSAAFSGSSLFLLERTRDSTTQEAPPCSVISAQLNLCSLMTSSRQVLHLPCGFF